MDFPKKTSGSYVSGLNFRSRKCKCKEIIEFVFLNTMFVKKEKKKHIVKLMFHNMLFLLDLKERELFM